MHTTVKFVFSKKATKMNEIFTVDLTVCSKCQIDGEDFFKFCGLFKGQLISKADWRAIDSPKKRTDAHYGGISLGCHRAPVYPDIKI